MKILLLSVLLLLIQTTSTLKILIFNPTFGKSHVNFLCAIAEKLMLGGHEVHMVMNTIDPHLKGCGSVNVHKMVHIPAREPNVMMDMALAQNPFKAGSMFSLDMMRNMSKSIEQICDDLLFYYDDFLKPLESEDYDVGISQLLSAYPFLILDLIGVKQVVVASANPMSPFLSDSLGIPAPSSYVANPFSDGVALSAPNFSFLERTENLIKNALFRCMTPLFMRKQHDFLKQIRSTVRYPADVIREASLLLINTPVMLDHAKPISHRVINIGGIAIKSDSHIDKEVLAIVERSKEGIVLVSFGTIAKTNEIEGELLESFLRAFSHFPDHEFLFKFDVSDEMKKKLKNYPNVHFLKWLQQSAILAHPKTRAFVSHMGLNSFMETSMLGVPVVAIPLFSDQPYNAAIAIQKGTGVYINKHNISEQSLFDGLRKVLREKSFKRNAVVLKNQLESFPDNGTERMLKYFDYIGRFGRLPDLDLKGAQMDLMTYYCLDIIIPLILSLLLISFILIRIFVSIVKSLFGKTLYKSKIE